MRKKGNAVKSNALQPVQGLEVAETGVRENMYTKLAGLCLIIRKITSR